MIPVFSYSTRSQNELLINEATKIDPSTNFFTQPLDQTPVATSLDADLPLTKIYQGKPYQKVAENDQLILFIHPISLGIAIYDKQAQYHWYSSYPDFDNASYSSGVKNQIASGIQIECFETTSSELIELARYSADTNERKCEIEPLASGCLISLDFHKIGISFQVKITIDGNKLITTFIEESLVEVPIKIASYEKKYKLKSITFFPYLGSNNYSINAYAMIPDGSGALIRYSDEEYQTAYIKRIYGNDYGIQNKSQLSSHLANQHIISMPIYGINHGYNQAAILTEITKGSGSAELHAYPYMYNNINLNRTFFKYLARDRFVVSMSTVNSISLINSEVYPNDYEVKYTFLQGNEASYIGMAKAYRENFELKPKVASDIPLKTDFIAQDYKPGLFGKKFVTMTSYRDVKEIVADLLANQVKNMEITYLGWNKGGYFDNLPLKPKIARRLGGKQAFQELMDFLDEQGIELYSYQNPLVTSGSPLSNPTIKRTNLQQFAYQFESSLNVTGYYVNPSIISENILKYQNDWDQLRIDSLNLSYLGNTSFSYLYKGKEVYREQMIDQLVSQVELLSSFQLGLITPNSYLFSYLDSYYQAPYESSRYAFVTDSIPFISLVLGGGVDLFAPYVNFISDSKLFTLRLIEYNLYPAFILTKNPSYYLRYTNLEHIYTSEYHIWSNEIKELYSNINDALKNVKGAQMINHQYLDPGVVEVTYDNQTKIVINYNSDAYNVGSKIVEPFNYLVIGEGS